MSGVESTRPSSQTNHLNHLAISRKVFITVTDLGSLRSSAEHTRVPNLTAAEVSRHSLDLLRQLAGGRQDESDRSITTRQIRLMRDVHSCWQDVLKLNIFYLLGI